MTARGHIPLTDTEAPFTSPGEVAGQVSDLLLEPEAADKEEARKKAAVGRIGFLGDPTRADA